MTLTGWVHWKFISRRSVESDREHPSIVPWLAAFLFSVWVMAFIVRL
jgi:hypothetical protein